MLNFIGISLGRYYILEQIGEGGMAAVFKAHDTRLERDVAIKVIRTDQFAPAVLDSILKRFEREAKLVAKLSHPNIVHINDYGEQDRIPYLVMDYLPGGTLKQRLGKPLVWQEAVKFLLPVAEALDYAHTLGVIHRDVKPSNILLTQRSQPMLTDFGIAKIIDKETTIYTTGTEGVVGTPEYMAPEQVNANPADQRADIYALGVVLYELIAGRKPFQADTPMAVMIMQARDPLPRLRQYVSDVPETVEKVLIKAMAKKPEDRYIDMGAFAHVMEGLLQKATEREKSLESREDAEKRIQQEAEAERHRKLEDLARLEEERKEREISNYVSNATTALDRELWNQVEQIATKLGQLGDEGQAAALDLRTKLAQAQRVSEDRVRRKEEDQARIEAARRRKEISRLLDDARTGMNRESWSLVEGIINSLSLMGEAGEVAAEDVRKRLKKAQSEAEDRTRHVAEEKVRQEKAKNAKEISRLLDVAKAGLDRESWGLVEKIINSLDVLGEAGEAAAEDVGKRLKKAQLEAEDRTRHVAEEKVRQEKENNAREIARLLNNAKVALDRRAWKKVEGICIQLGKFGEEGREEASKLQEQVVQARQEMHKSQKEINGKLVDALSADTKPDIGSTHSHSRLRWIVISALVFIPLTILVIWLGFHRPTQKTPILSVQPPPISNILTPSKAPDLSATLTMNQAPDSSVTPSLIATDKPLFGAGLKTLTGLTDNVYALAFSTDGQMLASGSNDKAIRLWRVSNGELLHVLEGHKGNISSLAFSIDGQILISGSGDGTVRLWKLPDGIPLRTLEASSSSIQSVSYSMDGKILASGSADGALKIWRASDGGLVQTIQASSGGVSSAAFSPDGKLLASGSSDNSVRIWRVSDGKLMQALTGHTGGINNLAFSPDGKMIASASSDGSIRLWIVADGSLLNILEGHVGSVLNIAFLEGGQTLVSGSEDGSIMFWLIPDGTQMLSLEGYNEHTTSVAFSPSGVSLALSYQDKTIRLWSLMPTIPSSPTPAMTITGTFLSTP